MSKYSQTPLCKLYYPTLRELHHLSGRFTITSCDFSLPLGAIIHVVTVSNQADIKRFDAFKRAKCMSFLHYVTDMIPE